MPGVQGTHLHESRTQNRCFNFCAPLPQGSVQVFRQSHDGVLGNMVTCCRMVGQDTCG